MTTPQAAADPVEARLDRIRGGVLPETHNARTISALASNPGCARRAIMDASGTNKGKVAEHAGFLARYGQSPFAIARGNTFEAMVKEDGATLLLGLLRKHIGLAIPNAHYHDFNTVGDSDALDIRHRRTRQELTTADPSTHTMFDHPLLRLKVGGRHAYLEPDLLALHHQGTFYVVEIKSFAIIDDQADPQKVAAASIQSAVYVHALRDLLGGDPGRVHDETILVAPENFANQPTAARVDVRKQLAVLDRQLSRIARIEDLLNAIDGTRAGHHDHADDGQDMTDFLAPDDQELAAHAGTGDSEDDAADLTFDLDIDPVTKIARRSPEDLRRHIHRVPANYAPECLASCELCFLCRDEAQGTTGALGKSVREELGGIDSIARALFLARGTREPNEAEEEITAQLRRAASIREQLLGEGI